MLQDVPYISNIRRVLGDNRSVEQDRDAYVREWLSHTREVSYGHEEPDYRTNGCFCWVLLLDKFVGYIRRRGKDKGE